MGAGEVAVKHTCPACNCAGLTRGGLTLVQKVAYLAAELRKAKDEILTLRRTGEEMTG